MLGSLPSNSCFEIDIIFYSGALTDVAIFLYSLSMRSINMAETVILNIDELSILHCETIDCGLFIFKKIKQDGRHHEVQQ